MLKVVFARSLNSKVTIFFFAYPILGKQVTKSTSPRAAGGGGGEGGGPGN